MAAETFSSSIDDLAEREAREWEGRQTQRALSVVADDPEPPRPRLVQVVLDGFMERPSKPPRYAIAGLVPRRHVTLLSAHGGSGKSMLGLVWTAHVACGQPWAGLSVCGPAKAVFVSLEDEASLVVDRLRRVVDEYGLNPDMVARNVVVFDGTGGDGALVVETPGRRLTPTKAMAEVEEAAREASLVTIDNGSDAFDGDEINRRQVRVFVRHLAGIARDSDAGLILLAHIDKASAKFGGEGNTYSGSTAWHNSARSRLALVDIDGVLELRQEKLNLGRRRDGIALKFTDHGVLVPGKADPDAVNAESDLVAQADASALLDVLWLAERDGIHVPTAMAGPVTAWHALEPLPELGKIFRVKDGRRRFNAALMKLARDSRIVRKTFMGANRHVRERWELAQPASEGLESAR